MTSGSPLLALCPVLLVWLTSSLVWIWGTLSRLLLTPFLNLLLGLCRRQSLPLHPWSWNLVIRSLPRFHLALIPVCFWLIVLWASPLILSSVSNELGGQWAKAVLEGRITWCSGLLLPQPQGAFSSKHLPCSFCFVLCFGFGGFVALLCFWFPVLQVFWNPEFSAQFRPR